MIGKIYVVCIQVCMDDASSPLLHVKYTDGVVVAACGELPAVPFYRVYFLCVAIFVLYLSQYSKPFLYTPIQQHNPTIQQPTTYHTLTPLQLAKRNSTDHYLKLIFRNDLLLGNGVNLNSFIPTASDHIPLILGDGYTGNGSGMGLVTGHKVK